MNLREKNFESKMSMRKLRDERRLQGLCVSCGAEKSDEKVLNCKTCREKRNKHEREIRIHRKEKALCSKCGKNLDRAGSYCNDCVSKVTNGTRRFRNKQLHS